MCRQLQVRLQLQVNPLIQIQTQFQNEDNATIAISGHSFIKQRAQRKYTLFSSKWRKRETFFKQTENHQLLIALLTFPNNQLIYN